MGDDILVLHCKEKAVLLSTYIKAKSEQHCNFTQDTFVFRTEQLTKLADHVLGVMRRIFKLATAKIHKTRCNALQSACNYMVNDFVKSRTDAEQMLTMSDED
jgi:hypothetical protein